MNNSIIFLDIDGVLNSTSFAMKNPVIGLLGMDLEAVQILVKIVKETGCKLVISSTWRKLGLGVGSDFRQELAKTDPSGTVLRAVIGATPVLGGDFRRGNEIQKWIDKNSFHGKFVILDDDSDMEHLKGYLVQTDNYVGLTLDDANEVISRLGRKI